VDEAAATGAPTARIADERIADLEARHAVSRGTREYDPRAQALMARS